ncbi:MAG TPA: serine hydrolase domain-containing protein [Acidobacteriota bacterium]|nr:serine hydrolase domain-containing protein [Acidobacteriota bacterium]HNB74153.1 serine hydrolase domain-containing protein [Acidobacteriota bacterium]HNG91823.1 serine hydrolase domain-containing protein [Acidobacteriota bacterium]HNH81687.1 serine hydrolase domain-containing protein [Acidobacteriota bacterium]HNJ40842.1 serine hydrolase domain-containing protein [Acidobacteriota bacterium]
MAKLQIATKKALYLLVLLFILLPGLPLSAFPRFQKPPTDFGELERVILAELQEKNCPGAALAIVKGDQLIYSRGFGVANIETQTPVTPDTLFQIGSITKTFTAVGVLGLVTDGKLKLDVPIGKYVQGLNPKLAQVTLHQLLSHTAGIIDEPDEFGSQDESLMSGYLRSWNDDYALFPRGELFSYSNSGFALAGFVAAEALGTRYTGLMAERVFQPLGMTRTTFQPTVAMTYPLAVGHQTQDKKPVVVRPLAHDARLYPAGTFYTSAHDMARFVTAILNGGKLDSKQVLAPSIFPQMQSPVARLLSTTDGTSYGYGLFMNQYRGVQQYWHEGSMTGYVAMMAVFPEQKVGYILLCNGNGVDLSKSKEKIMEVMLPLKSKLINTPAPSQPLTQEEMNFYAGQYFQPNRFRIEILIKNQQLFIKELGQEMPLTKIGEHRFSFQFPLAPQPWEIYIQPGKDGKPLAAHQYVWGFKKIAPASTNQ